MLYSFAGNLIYLNVLKDDVRQLLHFSRLILAKAIIYETSLCGNFPVLTYNEGRQHSIHMLVQSIQFTLHLCWQSRKSIRIWAREQKKMHSGKIEKVETMNAITVKKCDSLKQTETLSTLRPASISKLVFFIGLFFVVLLDFEENKIKGQFFSIPFSKERVMFWLKEECRQVSVEKVFSSLLMNEK